MKPLKKYFVHVKITKTWPVSLTRAQLQQGLGELTDKRTRFLFIRALSNLDKRNAKEHLTETYRMKRENDLEIKRKAAFSKQDFQHEKNQGLYE